MRRSTILGVNSLLAVVSSDARQVASACGNYRVRAQAETAMHERAQAMLRRSGAGGLKTSAGAQANGKLRNTV